MIPPSQWPARSMVRRNDPRDINQRYATFTMLPLKTLLDAVHSSCQTLNMKSETFVFSPRKRMKEALGTIAYVAPEAVFCCRVIEPKSNLERRGKGLTKGIFL